MGKILQKHGEKERWEIELGVRCALFCQTQTRDALPNMGSPVEIA